MVERSFYERFFIQRRLICSILTNVGAGGNSIMRLLVGDFCKFLDFGCGVGDVLLMILWGDMAGWGWEGWMGFYIKNQAMGLRGIGCYPVYFFMSIFY